MARGFSRRKLAAVGAGLLAGALLGFVVLTLTRGETVRPPHLTSAGNSTASEAASQTPSLGAAPSTPAGATPTVASVASASAAAAAGAPVVARNNAWLAYDGSSKDTILLTKGTTGVMQTWRWTASGWTKLHPDVEPDAPVGNITYDPDLGKLLFFAHSGVWEWDGSSWAHPDLGPLPSPLSPGDWRVVYDPALHDLLVLNPGVNAQNETWVFDGNQQWNRVSLSSSTPTRFGAGLAYDPKTQQVLYVGGTDPNSGALLNDTWVWNGRTWDEPHLTTTPGGGLSNLGYDPSTGELVLLDADGTWSWDGSSWHQLSTNGNPPPGSQNLDYSPAADGLVLFTPAGGSSGAAQTWIYSAGRWQQKA